MTMHSRHVTRRGRASNFRGYGVTSAAAGLLSKRSGTSSSHPVMQLVPRTLCVSPASSVYVVSTR